MTFKEYLLTQKDFSLQVIAQAMWPTNKQAAKYLSTKINGGLPFTEKDELKARAALNELGLKLIEMSKAKSL